MWIQKCVILTGFYLSRTTKKDYIDLLKERKIKLLSLEALKSQYVWVSDAFWQAEHDWDLWLPTPHLSLNSISSLESEKWPGMGRWGERLGLRAPRQLCVGNPTPKKQLSVGKTCLHSEVLCLAAASHVPVWLFSCLLIFPFCKVQWCQTNVQVSQK